MPPTALPLPHRVFLLVSEREKLKVKGRPSSHFMPGTEAPCPWIPVSLLSELEPRELVFLVLKITQNQPQATHTSDTLRALLLASGNSEMPN